MIHYKEESRESGALSSPTAGYQRKIPFNPIGFMADKTIFKRIIDKEIPAEIVYEDSQCLAFRDNSPQAPVHVLVIPKKEIMSTDHLEPEDEAIVGHIFGVIRQLASQLGLQDGYRVVTNCGSHGGQTVFHLHFHVLGGRPMLWPPG